MNIQKDIENVFDDGVFKPLEKIDIKELTKTRIVFPSENEQASSKESTLDRIIAIAKDCFDTALSTHHDKYLLRIK